MALEINKQSACALAWQSSSQQCPFTLCNVPGTVPGTEETQGIKQALALMKFTSLHQMAVCIGLGRWWGEQVTAKQASEGSLGADRRASGNKSAPGKDRAYAKALRLSLPTVSR